MEHHCVTASLSPLPARDPVAALAVAGGDADLAAELFAALLAGLPDELAALRAAVTAADWDGLAEHAHKVRGATRYCGVPALDEATESLERAARGGDPVRIATSFASLEAEAERVRQSGG
ncbi:Hpt domain-containing protein [uncultured Thiodictyon sp.]|uniref:Hpt domain-containing protein n=1 Tax=uncultured Thiodictyon sp. TaxID=1846217 RepID=UPI0025E45FEC|nr:Hpt domain-containing protein [uncultured Thiodictyon sp.]